MGWLGITDLLSVAIEVTTTFIFHDPSQLTSLQDNGLPWIVLNSIISKKVLLMTLSPPSHISFLLPSLSLSIY